MSFNATLHIAATIVASALLVAFLPMIAAAKSGNPATQQPHRAHHLAYREPVSHRGPMVAGSERLPYTPEYGFLSRVPPSAIQRPGYTFAPGKGIFSASCDLPTSACCNHYRDVQ